MNLPHYHGRMSRGLLRDGLAHFGLKCAGSRRAQALALNNHIAHIAANNQAPVAATPKEAPVATTRKSHFIGTLDGDPEIRYIRIAAGNIRHARKSVRLSYGENALTTLKYIRRTELKKSSWDDSKAEFIDGYALSAQAEAGESTRTPPAPAPTPTTAPTPPAPEPAPARTESTSYSIPLRLTKKQKQASIACLLTEMGIDADALAARTCDITSVRVTFAVGPAPVPPKKKSKGRRKGKGRAKKAIILTVEDIVTEDDESFIVLQGGADLTDTHPGLTDDYLADVLSLDWDEEEEEWYTDPETWEENALTTKLASIGIMVVRA